MKITPVMNGWQSQVEYHPNESKSMMGSTPEPDQMVHTSMNHLKAHVQDVMGGDGMNGPGTSTQPTSTPGPMDTEMA